MHYRTRYKSDLSPRQREVLDLVAKGYTNGQIAERLGLTLDGAKWHVSEILSKLDLDTREEAGRYWRAEHALPRRLARAMPGFGWLGLRPLLIVSGAAVAVVAGVAIYVAIQATDTGRHAADSAPTTQATVAVTATPPPFDYGTAVDAPTFQSVDMVSADVGWAISYQPPVVLRTEDGGGHWREVSPPGVASVSGAYSVAGSFFLNSERAWVAVTELSGATESTTVLRTDDGGRSWEPSAPVEGGHSGTLYFADALHGWLLQSGDVAAGQDPVSVYRTTNGGATWVQSSVSGGGRDTLPVSCPKSGIVFADAGPSTPIDGWVTGDCAGGTPFVYATADGGASWAPVSLPDPKDPSQPLGSCPCSFEPPQFVDSQHGFMPASVPDATTDRKYVYTTEDGGKAWRAADGPPVTNALATYAFADATHWFAATNGGTTLYETSDGGKTWSVVGTPTLFGDGVNSLQFTDAQHGWAVLAASGPNGEGSKLLKTDDGGKTWAAVGSQ